MGYGDAILPLGRPEGQQAVIEPLGLSLVKALLDLLSQVVGVQFGQTTLHYQHELASRCGVVDLILDGHEAYTGPSELLEVLQGDLELPGESVDPVDDEDIVFARYGVLDGLEEHWALADIVCVGGAAFLHILPVYGPVPVLNEVGKGTALSTEAVALDLIFAADSGV